MAVILDDLEYPEDITDDEYEQLKKVLLHNVERGDIDPLNDLTEPQHELLARLAFNDEFNLDLLKMSVQAAIRLRNDKDATAQKFNFRRYLTKAKKQRDAIAEAASLRARLAKRNASIADAGKPDSELRDAQRQTANSEQQAKLLSNNAFLKALGMLETQRKGRVWFDEFYNNFITDWDGTDNTDAIIASPLTDAFMLRVLEWLLMSDVSLSKSLSLNKVQEAIHGFGNKDIRNEPRQWLSGLEWDKVPRLATWLMTVYGVDNDSEGYHASVGRCWLVSMVARIMRAGAKVDTMPVLMGVQGKMKSTSLEILGGRWYTIVNTSAEKMQDFCLSLNGKLIGEIAELDAISRSTDSRVKTLLSTAVDNFRPPYGRVAQEFPRTAVLAGTTNDRNWHKDDTGGRRYWPLVCDRSIDLDWLRDNREQLFAEAKVLHDAGSPWWDVPEEAQRRRVMSCYTEDPWQDRIAGWIEANKSVLWVGDGCGVERRFGDPSANEMHAHWGTMITTSRVMTECLGIPVERQARYASNKVALVMRNLGYEQTSIRGTGKLSSRQLRAWRATHLGEGDGGQKLFQFKDVGDE